MASAEQDPVAWQRMSENATDGRRCRCIQKWLAKGSTGGMTFQAHPIAARGCSSCVGDVEILIPSGGLSADDSVDAGAGQLLVAWWLSCRSAWQCRQVGPSLITVEADEARAAECSRHISSRPGPSSCVGVVEILIASGSSSAADPVDAWGCCRRCCHVNARASRWRPVSCRWWSGCRTGE